jgi:murein DD-endopeptidase MepM/ murein hydrolase activator NlpD
MLVVACGQYSGVHREADSIELRDTRQVAPASSRQEQAGPDGSAVLASPNGENSGRNPSITSEVIDVTTEVPSGPRTDGPLHVCPVLGEGFYSDDFGAPRFAGGYHPHAGNDMFATVGTPVVAPFDGTAVATPNFLGGLAVKVYGRDGYVYNAHLVGYGKLGPVRTGDVVGYVGNTGDALGGPPHNHFEWHPNDGPAVNPFPYLEEVC